VKINENRIASCEKDGNIKIWDINNFLSISTLYNENNISFTALLNFENNILISGDSNGTIKIWNIEEANLLKSINAFPYHSINQLMKINDFFFGSCAHGKNEIKIWEINTCNCIKEIYNDEGNILGLVNLKNNVFVTYDHSSNIKIRTLINNNYNIYDYNDFYDIIIDEKADSVPNKIIVKFSDSIILRNDWNGNFTLFDVNTKKIMRNKFKGNVQIKSMCMLNDKDLIYFDGGNRIKIWKNFHL
jgi:WD40 repeat protein